MAQTDREKRLKKVIGDLQKKHGENVVRTASQIRPNTVLPFGIAPLDLDLGGGMLWGKIMSLAGSEGSGKTSLAYVAAAKMLKIGGMVFWVDLERAFDNVRAAIFGVDIGSPNFIVYRSGETEAEEFTAEILFEKIKDIIRVCKQNKIKCMVILDSLSANASERIQENVASKVYGGSALENNHSITVWNNLLADNMIMLIINQLRQKLDSMGDPNMMPGGMAQLFYASNIVWLRAGETLKDGTDPIGQEMRWTMKKTRTSFPKVRGQVNYYYATGFDKIAALVDTAIEMELFEQSGAWITLPAELQTPEITKVNGKAKLLEFLQSKEEFLNRLVGLVYNKMPLPLWDGELDASEEKSAE
jgi:recombination protein RecA